MFVCKPPHVCVHACACLGAHTTYIVVEELHHKGGHAAVDTNEEVDAGQHHVGRAGHAEDEGGGVHHRGDGPPGDETPSHEWTERGNKDPPPPT